MRTLRRLLPRPPSPAMVVAVVALVVALGGSAYAIKKIGTKQLKNGAVSTKKLKDGAVTERKLATAARGKVVAYATVSPIGDVVEAESSGISDSQVEATGSHYCFHGLPFSFKTAVATARYADNEAGVGAQGTAEPDRPPFQVPADCASVSGTQLEVATFIGSTAQQPQPDVSGFVVAFLR